MDWSLVVATFLFIAGLVWTYLSGITRLPPGPLGFPIVGYLPMMIGKRPHEVYTKLGEKYGKVVSFYLGNRLIIVLGTLDAVKEALIRQGDNFSGRPHFHFTNQGNAGNEGIIRSEGEIWRNFRRFSTTTLKALGMGQNNIEHRIKEEIGYFLSALGEHQGQPFDITELLNKSVGNIICTILFGQRSDYKDSDFSALIENLEEYTKRLAMHEIHEFLPFLMKIPGISKITRSEPATEFGIKMEAIILKKIMEHKSPYTQVIQSDFIDAWLAESLEEEEPDVFTDENLVQVARSLFVAGTDTLSNTLRWALLFMVAHPEVQKKVQREVDEVVPYLQSLAYQDRNRLPYTEATLTEVQRMIPVLPLSVTHSNFKETYLFGHLIPKRSTVLPNIYAVHHNPAIFTHPEQFLPERFMDELTKKTRMEHIITFSVGKRQCLGESLARMEIFLYFVSMVRCFHFSMPDGDTISFESINSSMTVAKPFKLLLVPRYGKQTS